MINNTAFRHIKNFVPVNHRARFICLLLANTFLVVLLCNILPIRFEDNDDITSAWICNGIYSGIPDGHLVFINALYGYFVAGLYRVFPSVEWYTVLYLIWHIISFTVIIDFFHRIIKNIYLKYLIYVLIYISFIMVAVRLQFTTMASVAAFAGVLLLCERKWLQGGLLFVLGSLIRFESAGLVGLLMAPMIIYNYRLDIKRAYIPISAILLLVLSLHILDSRFYQGDDWKSFMECSKYLTRGRIEDNPNIWKIYNNLPKDISVNNYCLTVGFCHDPQAVSAEQLKLISKQLSSLPLLVKLPNLIKPVKKNFICFFSIALLTICLLFAGGHKEKIFFLCTMLLLAFFLLSICLNATLKLRVLFSALLAISYATFTMTDIGLCDKKWLYIPVTFMALIWFIGMMKAVDGQIRKSIHGREVVSEQMNLYAQRGTCAIVPDGPDFQVELFNAFHLRDAIEPKSFINPYCFAGAPLNTDYKSHSDYINKNICLFSKKENGYEERFKALQENYGIDADTVHIASSEHYVLTRFIVKSNE